MPDENKRSEISILLLITSFSISPNLEMSTKQKLEDRNHRTVGYIVTASDGKQHVEDPSGRTWGYYDPKQDKTEDRSHRTVGYGNLLATLLPHD